MRSTHVLHLLSAQMRVGRHTSAHIRHSRVPATRLYTWCERLRRTRCRDIVVYIRRIFSVTSALHTARVFSLRARRAVRVCERAAAAVAANAPMRIDK